MKNIIILISMLLVLTSIGCQTSPKLVDYNDQVDQEYSALTKVPVYFWDRFLDFTDIAQLNLGFGDGFLMNMHLTKWMQMGVGYRDGVCVGFMPRSFGIWHEDRTEGGLAFMPLTSMYWKDIKREALFGTQTLFNHDTCYAGVDHMSNDIAHWSDLGVSLHLFLIGADLNLSPFQAFDFVFGFFGMPWLIPVDRVGFGTEIDVGNDDVRAREFRNDSDLPYYNYTLDPHPKGE